jgi:hypothetical protein
LNQPNFELFIFKINTNKLFLRKPVLFRTAKSRAFGLFWAGKAVLLWVERSGTTKRKKPRTLRNGAGGGRRVFIG